MTKIKFGTSGWRAILSEDFTFANVGRAVDAIALYLRGAGLQERPVIVSSDTRFMADKFRAFASERLAGHGFDVLLTTRDCPTPVVSFVIRARKLAGGINFTASHNPPEYQGIKFSPRNGAPAGTDATAAIEQLVDQPVPPAARKGSVSEIDPREDYLAELNKFIAFDAIRAARMNIAVDVLWGTGRGYLDEALRRAGSTVTMLHDVLNPLFGGRRPEPSAENLGELIALMKKGGYDIGLATDGDADRFGVIDRDGTFYNANMVLCFTAWHLFRNRKKTGRIVRTVATTCYLDRIAKHFGLEVAEVPVGFKYIGPLIDEGNVLVGGEESGGLSIGGHIPEKDGVLACCLMAELVAMEKKPLGAIAKDIEKAAGSLWNDRVDLSLTQDKKARLLERLAAQPHDTFLGRTVAAFNGVDGYKFTFGDAEWTLIRPSGTEPIIRCYMESDTKGNGEKLKKELLAFLRAG